MLTESRFTLFVLCLATSCSGAVGGASSGGDDAAGGDGGSSGVGGDSAGGAVGKPVARNPTFDLACPAGVGPFIGSSPLTRLTNVEYNNTLADLFGPANVQKQGLPAEVIADGFNNDAVAQSPSTVLIENLEAAPITITDATIDKAVGCQAASAVEESACLDKFFSSFAKRLYRRPLTATEISRYKTFVSTLRKTDDFASSVRTLVRGMMQSPQFLYRAETGESASDKNPIKLTGYEVASRLSYLLWDTMPDADLFAAAEAGELDNADGIAKQTMRLMGDPRARGSVSEFVRQWLEYDRIDNNIAKKNATTFPKYTDATKAALSSGLRKFVEDAIWSSDTSLRDMLLSKKAYVSDASAFIYNVGAPGAELKSMAVDNGQRAGLLTQAGFLAGFGHETLQAPILRGIFVLDRLLCQPPPPPPVNVNTALADPPKGAGPTTLRQRIEMSHQKGACASCHKTIDAVGFGLENFDAIGQYRTIENTLPVDARGSISDTFDANGDFNGAVELAERLAKSEQVSECVTAKMVRYALSRAVEPTDGCTISSLTDGMVQSGGDIKSMMLALVKGDSFRYRAPITP
ncbi:MAG: DUF1592 domain-containing protein [Deltaproteobacteria bacterium]|nr:DUF1592 domain-containing protein [Deltaproteobacteria bacterium]